MGPYFTSHVEERVAELLDKEGFHNENDIGQLWYGLALCKYKWDSALLTRLAAGTVGGLSERELLTSASSTLANMAQQSESISLTDQHKAELARAIAILTDRVADDLRSTKSLAGMTDLSKLGVKPETPAEAQAWFELLNDIAPTKWTLEEVRVGLGTLASCNTYSPSPEAKQMVLDAAASKGVRSAADAGVLLQLSEAWGIALPAEVRARLVRMRGSGGPKP
ncbi:hypothetical protein CHLRE_07g322750v5 [Chlamydomonas reinhardtii]|uniref:Uncharacterized protein n=1 Tax=Chlamydomonas reinhardtii TaxID=3055 RepID=A0A2K3DJ54_CHLRE|nr:uncharacterized protein CHLRE_07g322750v5 [Chlamydomonas reinhardtii]PNW80560.1 hypothetical protein CHLRE_07g322750v5 [Chlamydomonas reinhardtii]